MSAEELLKMLRDAQMDDDSIKTLLSEAMASLEGAAEGTPAAEPSEEDEKAEAGRLLGVSL